MVPVPPEYNPHSIESEVLSLWRARRLPPAGGGLGPPTGPAVRQFTGSWTVGGYPSLVVHRALAADVDARYLGLVGRRVVGTLRDGTGPGPSPPSPMPALLAALGIWTGGDGQRPWDGEDRTAGVQKIAGRLASQGVLVARDEAFRACPTCGSPRCLESIIYDEQEGDTYLVRFPIHVGDLLASALVWVDSPWKLLGTSALLVNPQLRYAVVNYRRREEHELVLTSVASLGRLRKWIPDATFEVVEERPGKDFQGTAYSYPLRHEFPIGGDLTAPAGTILSASDVGESGTGIVPLVPGHGPTDAQIAARFGVTGWPLVTPKGRLDFTLMHKYAGLDLATTDEFVLRDLSEAGALFARLRVKRGVPCCGLCGTALFWSPGKAWCLEPSRLPPERRALFARLLPAETLPGQAEVAPWPVSEATVSEDPGAIALLECARCDRLEAPGGPIDCPCGGRRTVVRRRLLPSVGAVLAGWARFDPFPDGDSVHLYVGQRRRVPSLVHHLVGLSGIQGFVGDVSLTVVPTFAAIDVADLVATYGADVVRGTMIRTGPAEATGGRFAERCRQEAERLRRWWSISRDVVSMCDPAMLAAFARPIGGFVGELEVEDRAILARWEKTRSVALAHYDQSTPALVHRQALQFLDNDLVEYRTLVQSRIALTGTPTTKRSALRTLVHLLQGLSEILAPIFPFTSEAVHRSLSPERTSLFEQPLPGLERSLLNDELVAAWGRWRTVVRAVERFRASFGIPRSTLLPSIALVVPADDIGDKLRAEKETLARLVGTQRLDIGSPREPWTGRRRALRPVESEIQKAYPAQASQIVHLISRMAPRRWEGALGEEELTVVINGLPRRIFPNMVAFLDTLPERVVPFPWSMGEMYLELPSGAPSPRPSAPPLSPDGFWFVRRLDRRLRTLRPATDQPPRVAVVTAQEPLATELKAAAGPIARYLGLRELRIVEKSEEAKPPNAITGRTRTGTGWWAHVPNLPTPCRRTKPPRPTAHLRRVAVATTSVEPKETDYADAKFVAHEEEVRALGRQLDDLVGVPLLGPSKIALAWDQGLHSVEDMRNAPFEAVAALPGFGGPVAEVVVTRLGGSIPVRARSLAFRAPPRETRPLGVSPNVEVPAPSVTPSPPAPVPPEVPRLTQAPPTEEAKVEENLPLGETLEMESEILTEGSPPQVQSAETREVAPEPAPRTPLEVPESPPPGANAEAEAEGEPSAETPPLAIPSAETAPEASAPAEEAVTAPPLEISTESPTPPPVEAPAETPPPAETIPISEGPLPEPELPVEGENPVPAEGTAVPEVMVENEGPTEAAPLVEGEFAGPQPPEEAPGPGEPPPESTLPETTELLTEPAPPSGPSSAIVTEATPAAELAPDQENGTTLASEPVPPPPAEAAPADESVASPPPVEEIPAAPPREEAPFPMAPTAEEAPAPAPEGNEAVLPPPVPPEVTPPPTTVVPEPDVVPVPPVVSTPLGEPELPPITPESSAVLPPTPAAPASIPTPPEPPSPAEAEPPLPPSGVELTIGDSLVVALGGFLESTAAGHPGVCVVRESPERIRARVGPRPIEVLWLTNIGRGPALRPSDLDGVWTFLSRRLLEEHVTAFFLEGIEYLVRLHGADSVLNGLVAFDRLARENDARVWVCLTPGLMKPPDLERFRSTFGGVTVSD